MDLLVKSNPKFKDFEKIELESAFEYFLAEVAIHSIGQKGIEILVVWEYAKCYHFERIELLKYINMIYNEIIRE